MSRLLRATVVTLVAGLVGGLAVALPAYASSPQNPTFTSSSYAAGATASWTVAFTSTGNGALAIGDHITITFPAGFAVPATFTPTVTWGSASTSCTGSAGAGNAAAATVTVGCAIPKAKPISVVVPGVTNGPAGTYQGSGTSFSVSTSGDQSAAYPSSVVIYGPPALLAFTASPASPTTAGTTFSSQPVVTVEDSGGRTVGNSSASVSLAVTGGGAAISCTSSGTTTTAVNGVAAFTGCSITKTGTYTLTATSTGLTSASSAAFTITAGAASKLSFAQAPSDAYVGSAMTPAVTVQLQDQYGNAVAASGVAVTLTPSAGSMTGGSATTNAAGLATFSGIQFGNTILGVTLTATSTGVSSATSPAVNVTVKVTTAAATLTDTASDTGSGVKTVAYYYCSGLSGTCTAGNGTLIGSSTNPASNFAVTWTNQPANGPYRLATVGTDNVGNANAPTTSTPVTVSN